MILLVDPLQWSPVRIMRQGIEILQTAIDEDFDVENLYERYEDTMSLVAIRPKDADKNKDEWMPIQVRTYAYTWILHV